MSSLPSAQTKMSPELHPAGRSGGRSPERFLWSGRGPHRWRSTVCSTRTDDFAGSFSGRWRRCVMQLVCACERKHRTIHIPRGAINVVWHMIGSAPFSTLELILQFSAKINAGLNNLLSRGAEIGKLPPDYRQIPCGTAVREKNYEVTVVHTRSTSLGLQPCHWLQQ